MSPYSVTFRDADGDGGSYTLRLPEFGDKRSLDENRIYRTTRGLSLRVFRDPIWPTQETMSLEFAHLTDDVRRGFLDFLTTTLGRVLVYRDHLGQSWRGFVSKPDFGMTQSSRNQSSIKVEFQIVPDNN